MAEKVFLVHGWSVDETTTYQALHKKLDEFGYDLKHIYLGRYVSLDDQVEIKDISRAMHNALKLHLGSAPWSDQFHMITHSTGALVVKDWVAKHYTGKFCEKKPLKNLVFLAGPHFGSRLAHHGRSMIAHAVHLGPTGNKVLNALELGSNFSWENNSLWLEKATWQKKEIRPFCLIGDRVEGNFIKSKIFPAAFEDGSDMVVRVPAANLNFRRFELKFNGATKKVELQLVDEITGVPFAALADYVHSGDKNGIMNSITSKARPDQAKYLNLNLILKCLGVKNQTQYDRVGAQLAQVTKATREGVGRRRGRRAFAQLDFRFSDETGAPVDDYSFTLGVVVKGKNKASDTVAHTHKNKVDGSHFTVFIDLKEFKKDLTYFIDLKADSGTPLFDYNTKDFEIQVTGKRLTDIISADHTTQIDVKLDRRPHKNLFVFHPGNDKDLHVKWNRKGEITKTGKAVK